MNVRVLNRWRTDFFSLVAYMTLSVVMLWPAVQRLSTHLIGNDVDVWINPWSDWWIEKALREGHSLFFTNLMFYPQGITLFFHSFSYFNTAVAFILRPLLGTLGAANTTVLIAHVLSGYGVFCLTRYVTHSSKAAFFAGLVYAFFPYRLGESSHPVIVSTEWIPFYLLYLIRCVRENRLRFSLLSTLFLILTALSSWHLFLFAILLSLIYLGYVVAVERRYLSKQVFVKLLLIGALTLIVLSPLLLPMLRELLTGPQAYYQAEPGGAKGNDLLGFILPAQFHSVWGQLVAPIYDRIQRPPIYLGFTALGLTLLAIWRDWRRARFWVILLGITMFFSIGPNLQFNGQVIAGPLPWSEWVARLVRHPFRLNVLLGLALAVASGLGLAQLLDRLGRQRSAWPWVAVTAAAFILLFEYLAVPFPTIPAVVPDFFVQLVTQPNRGAILSLPMGRQPSKPTVFYQTVHGWPIVEGVVSRTPADAYAWIDSSPILRSLRACDRNFPPADLASLLPRLSQAGIAYVTLYPAWVPPDSVALWRSSQSLAPDYEDAQVIAYKTDVPTTAQLETPQLLDSCLGIRSLQTDLQIHAAGEVVAVPIEWTMGNRSAGCCELRLSIRDEHGKEVGRWGYPTFLSGLTFTVSGTNHTMTYPLPISLNFLPGRYHVNAQLIGTNTDPSDSLIAYLFDLQIIGH
jgi:hypothetical protein